MKGLFQLLTHSQFKILHKLKVSSKFGRRAECDPKEFDELRRGTHRISFCDVGGNRRGGATDLVGKAKMTR